MQHPRPDIQASKNPGTDTTRIPQLDALRGIAAVTVVCHHWWAICRSGPPPWIFRPLVTGREAVILFFVLSGFVLSLPVWNKRQAPYPEYLLRRIFRIYVPFVFALVLSALGCLVFYGRQLPLTSFYYTTWQTPLTAALFARELLMPTHSVLNGAIWSLRYEMELSILFPFLCLFLLRTGRWSWLILTIGLRAGEYLLVHNHYAANIAVTNFARFLYYSIFFIVGATLARERITLARLLSRIPRPILWILLLAALGSYCNTMFAHSTVPASDLFTTLGAAAMILLVQDPRLTLGLNSSVPQYLGRISYSMYLVHYTVLFAVFDLAFPGIPLLSIAILCGAATWLVSHLFCIWIEEPAHAAGKSLAHRLRTSNARPTPLST